MSDNAKMALYALGALIVLFVVWKLAQDGGDGGMPVRFTTLGPSPAPAPDDSARIGALADVFSTAIGGSRDVALANVQRDIEASKDRVSAANAQVYAQTIRAVNDNNERTARQSQLLNYGSQMMGGGGGGSDFLGQILGAATSILGIFGI